VIFSKQGYLVRLTDEQAADVWPVEVLTPEEQELARKVERVQSERLLEEYRERLAKADPALQPIIEHHWVDERWTCQGCDAGSYAEDSPDWPCSTIDLILEGLE
jgi:predicted thioredoxin/glutaredoxin